MLQRTEAMLAQVNAMADEALAEDAVGWEAAAAYEAQAGSPPSLRCMPHPAPRPLFYHSTAPLRILRRNGGSVC